MVSKKCAGCGQYFAGELNGDYLCAACAHLEPQPRPLSSLSGLSGLPGLDPVDSVLDPSPDSLNAGDGIRRPSASAPADSERTRNVKGQAA